MSEYRLMVGDCVERLRELQDSSVDAVVTDPPYGLSKQPDMAEVMRHWLNGDDYRHKGAGFMGKSWDSFVPGPSVWRECFRVLKPGGHLLSFFGSRTYDIGALAIRLAGFEVRDQIMWVYGSGFPKSLDVSKAIDKAAGAAREQRWKPVTANSSVGTLEPRPWLDEARKNGGCFVDGDIPATDAAKQWQGWGTALKPAHEPIVMARKPISGTVAANVLEHDTGAINVDGCRIGNSKRVPGSPKKACASKHTVSLPGYDKGSGHDSTQGRWPANFIHDGSDEVVELFPESKGSGTARVLKRSHKSEQEGWGMNTISGDEVALPDAGSGSAARFFYCAKASKRDRDEGLDVFEIKRTGSMQATADGSMLTGSGNERNTSRANTHPTVKPTDLMRYLVRMVTPPNGLVLDPFTGSGSTGKACMIEGFDFVGCELSDEYADIAKARMEHAKNLKPDEKPQSELFDD